jgi:uncharacterized UBP type Zn finger protein
MTTDPTAAVHYPQVSCPHMPPEIAAPVAETCQECGSGVNLRMCATCGHVGCCESQAGHNTAHARASGHPVIYSLPLGPTSFTWCYEENRYLR